MKRSDAFPSRFLSSDEIGNNQYKLVIGNVVMEEMTDDDGRTKDVPVCHFQNTQKVMRLNATNWDTLERAFGDDSEGWYGQQVVVYVDNHVKFGKKFVKGLRLRTPSRPATTPPIEHRPDMPQSRPPTPLATAYPLPSIHPTSPPQSEDPAIDPNDEIPF